MEDGLVDEDPRATIPGLMVQLQRPVTSTVAPSSTRTHTVNDDSFRISDRADRQK